MTDAPGLPPVLFRALKSKGYDTLTEVQDSMLAPELAGRDLLVSAQTGSGKTVAFGLALGADLLDEAGHLPPAGDPVALAVAPTRELAMQVARELSWLYAEAGVKVATCVGGMDVRAERQALGRGAQIVVGTPGRLVDHINRYALRLDNLRAVVLDEADEMLNLGFREELEAILEACPEERRTLMFSATVAGGIAKLAGKYQTDALRISASGPQRQHDDIAYHAMLTAQHDTERAIINTLRFHEAENAIVFCSTRAAVARLTSRLANRGFSVVSLSGELSQQERTNALQAMRDGRARVCVATDVAARGIDLPGLELVIHADLPKNREGLLHRSGRTGRAGRKGTSVLIVPPRARRFVERLLAEVKVDAHWSSPPSADEVRARDDQRLLSDPVLTEEAEPSDLASRIAEAYSAEHLAAAIVRMHQAGRSAPEEISEVAETTKPRERKKRDEIEDAVWITLTVGRKQRAEPRWLLPMLCKNTGIRKGAIGAIRIQEETTFVQLDAEGASDFLIGMERGKQIEEGIEARLAKGPPPAERRGPKPPFKPRGRTSGKSNKPRFDTAKSDKPKTDKPWRPEDTAVLADTPPALKRKPKKSKKPTDGQGPRKRLDTGKPYKARKKRTG
ncbi:DEAD/DEAH box helicase [Parvularcula lutaonensis]|uniref:DEAD/DEAH box helicase n=1 Tax=Parvularcula lutaonensis TaxID=491923 RepID=A0ABV7MDE8_9PROT